MDFILDAVEARVLGCLIEKELTTPEYYPLTINSLLAACNQKSNRSPVMSLTEADISRALDSLRGRHLAWEHHGAGMRVAKYSHNIKAIAELLPQQTAVLCELLVRGPQTPGELRTRAGRMFGFRSAEEIDEVLRALAAAVGGPLVCELARAPGRRESRFAHLLSGQPQADTADTPQPQQGAAREAAVDRLAELEKRVAALEERLAGLDDLAGRLQNP